jgi:predicted pyridoxine 5'-phosphate oxidase superfamily flavin-nucleotide-binding protein
MTNVPMYHDGMRTLQDIRETRPLADRLEQVIVRTAFTDEDRAFIARCPMFFIATADAHGHPECSYKGGTPGFVRPLDDGTLAIPDYDGNGMYRTWGNVLVNPHVGLLFIDFENPKPLRVNGTARLGRRPTARGLSRIRLHRSYHTEQDLSELPALHLQDADRRTVGLFAALRLHAAGTGVEDV